MMPTIRVDDDVFQGLKSIAEPFTDTPNTVIRRLLTEIGVLQKSTKRVDDAVTAQNKTTINLQSHEKKDTTTSLTLQPIYETFLLHVLCEKFKGHAGKHEVTKAVIELMQSRGFINSADLKRVSTGETKAENTIAWGRNALKERGLISRNSPKGSWELTPKGIEEAARVILPRR